MTDNKKILRKYHIYLFGGLALLAFVLIMVSKIFPHNREGDFLDLLQRGVISNAEVTETCYSIWAPAGWVLRYRFTSADGSSSVTHGGVKGPCEYYAGLSVGELVEIVYDPQDLGNNMELRFFLENPNHKNYAKKLGVNREFAEYREQFGARDYSYVDWYESQNEKCVPTEQKKCY